MILDDLPDDGSPSTGGHLAPRQEGSETALLVLQRMADWRVPISSAELRSITDLDYPTLRDTLRGLALRGRVVCTARGPSGRWVLAHLATEHGVEVPH